jgi:hypothetical protein
MKNSQRPTTPLRLAVINAPPAVIPFPTIARGPKRQAPRGRNVNSPTAKAPDATLGQLRTRLYRMIVENERGRTHGNRAS